MAEGEWQTATSRRGRRKGGTANAIKGSPQHHAAYIAIESHTNCARPPTERQLQRTCTLLEQAACDLRSCPLWQHLHSQLQQLPAHCALRQLQRMVVYGLGSLEQPGAVHIRYQLAAAQLLAALLPLAAQAEAFDPVFTALDRAVLSRCNIQVTPHDEGGQRIATAPTLFFMPHCEAVLTDALLAANLAAGTLHNLVVLGNRFSGYRARWSLLQESQQQSAAAAEGRGQPSTMLRLCECSVVQELAVSECGFPVASAFNDLGLHWFPPDWQQRLSSGKQVHSARSEPDSLACQACVS